MATAADDVVMRFLKDEGATLHDVFPLISRLADIHFEDDREEREAKVNETLEALDLLNNSFPDEWLHIMMLGFMVRTLYRELQESRRKLDEVVSSQIRDIDPDRGK